jgi:hypothetical protein
MKKTTTPRHATLRTTTTVKEMLDTLRQLLVDRERAASGDPEAQAPMYAAASEHVIVYIAVSSAIDRIRDDIEKLRKK